MRKHEIEKELAKLRVTLENFEINPDNYEEEYKDLIDELDGVITVAGMKFRASRILEELDPIAFRCGLSDYVDTLDVRDDDEYKALEDELADLEDELSDLEDELSDLEDE